MSEHMPYDPDFTPKHDQRSHAVQVTLTKEQIFMIGLGMGVAAALVYLALING